MRGAGLAFLLTLVLLAGCQRETRQNRPEPGGGGGDQPVPVTTLAPGGQRPDPGDVKGRSFEANAFHLSEGKRLYGWFNCSGCHANGGGGFGPALMDDKWIYGGSAGQIYRSIVEGRKNGMPAFGHRIPQQQVWQLVAFVRAMALRRPIDAMPGREDELHPHSAESLGGRAPIEPTPSPSP
jgi:cytochrome c oxidase cbb3-type subunit 3